ncbi:myeloid cell surface antigen CD33-like [Pyxicephalus adspersus]|uniref:myeloid cell surface antigen CD33-like n=1 Tax=Pyxicephalus adspersus TaxID=30357 RepID=UPI003B59E58A
MRVDISCNYLVRVVTIILFKLCKDFQCQFHFGYSLEVNTRVTVQELCSVTIPCAFTADDQKSFTNSSGYWNSRHHIIVASTNANVKGSKPNFLITGNPNKGDCTLTITDAKKEDSGMYYFEFEGPVRYNYQEKSITVNVTDSPKESEVVINSVHDCGSMNYTIIALIASGNIIAISLIAVGLYFLLKRLIIENKIGGGSRTKEYKVGDVNKSETLYQGLTVQTESVYHDIKSSS